MYQHELSTEGIPPGLSVPHSPPDNLTSHHTEEIHVKVEPTLTRVDSIEGGPRRITRKEKIWKVLKRVGLYFKTHQAEEWYAFKVALAMVLSSIVVLLHPTYQFFGVNSLWLLISVIIIYEPTVGSLLSRGLNRMIGTVFAVVLSLVCAVIAEACGRGEVYVVAVFLGLGGLLIGFLRQERQQSVTYSAYVNSYRNLTSSEDHHGIHHNIVYQVPLVKGKYDYAALIALVTFGLLTLSEYRFHEGPKLAGFRLLLIFIGFAIAFGTNILIKPSFAGNDLHTIVSGHFLKIASSLESCVQAYLAGTQYAELQKVLDGVEPEDKVYEGFRTVIVAKAEEDSLHDLVLFEPPHGHFHFKYPWELYKDMSRLCRHCMYTLAAMDGCLRSEFQCPVNLRQLFARPMLRLAQEARKALEAMGESVTEMKLVNLRPYIQAVEVAALDLQRELQENADLLITPTPETDRLVEKFLDEEDEKARASMSSSKARRSAAESAEGKPPSTEDDESVEFSFPIMHTEENFTEEGYSHADSYGHQSRVTPERSLLQDLQERHRPSVELTYLEPLPPISRQGSLADRISSKPSSRQLMVPVPGGIAVLSLVQFVCALVEFAARLSLLVSCVNALGEKAGFSGDGKVGSRRESSERRTHVEEVTTDL